MRKEFYEERPVAYLRNRLFVPKECVTRRMKDDYTQTITDFYSEWEEDDNGNYILDDQRQRIPRECRDYILYGYKIGQNYVSFDRGNLRETYNYFHRDYEIVDERSKPKLPYELRFLGVLKEDVNESGSHDRWPLRPEQVKAIDHMEEEMYGILDCNPRFGKTICACKLTCDTGLRTLVLVGQEDLADQFLTRLRSSTNIGAIERKAGKRLAGQAHNLAEFKQFDICVTTWQKLHRNPGLAHEIRKLYGFIIVDEVHQFASECSPVIVDRFWAKYKIGLTATPTRKDKREPIITNLVGPVTVKGRAKQVPLYVHIVNTKFCPEIPQNSKRGWNSFINKLCHSGRRNKLACDLIEADVKAGRKVLVSTTRVDHMRDLKERLEKRGISCGIFNGSTKKRKEFFKQACSGAFDVTIGNQQMLTGIDVPVWSAMHLLIPSSNQPKFYQVFSRVRTPVEGKLYALLYEYLDACGASNGCYRTRHAVYLNKDYKPIYFVDKHNNIMGHQPKLKEIIDAANRNEPGKMLYGDGLSHHVESSAKDSKTAKAELSATGWMKGHSRWGWHR